MKKNLFFVSMFYAAVSIHSLDAQQRYLDDVFTAVTVTNDVTYAQNITVITGSPALSSLKMDVYEPTGDTLTARPLVLLFHTGSFLPAVMNGQPTGSKKDSAVVEMCIRFAKKGYVAAAVTYRQGWNPLASSQDVRTGTLINAAYRGVQDAHTCVRYFRKDIATNGNQYKVDGNRIAIGGIGTGSYISLAYAYFDKYSELNMAKFVNFNVSPPAPYIDTTLSGDFQGTLARPLNNPSNVGYSSAVNMVFNCGGALGDSSWLEAGNIPVVGLHCTKDPNAPYKTGAVIVPTTGDFVLEASGSHDILRRANNTVFGDINAILKLGTYSDPYTTRANQLNNGYEGLFPFVTPAALPGIMCSSPTILLPGQEQGAPWDWWNEAWYKAAATSVGQNGDTMACNAKRGNPDMSPVKGRKYIDTIQGYLAPRIVNVLALPGNTVTGMNESAVIFNLNMYPNPSSNVINITTSGTQPISSIEIYNITGKLVRKETGINAIRFTLSKQQLSEGMYFMKVFSGEAESVHKVIFN